jgi:ornithine carbamoyltransferase
MPATWAAAQKTLWCSTAARAHGRRITRDVFEAHANEIFDEAENRLHAQKAVMTLLLSDKQA